MMDNRETIDLVERLAYAAGLAQGLAMAGGKAKDDEKPNPVMEKIKRITTACPQMTGCCFSWTFPDGDYVSVSWEDLRTL